MSFDYSNTSIYCRNTQLSETKSTNSRLKNMYDFFYEKTASGFDAESLTLYGYNGVQLLTCFDAYVKAKNKIMVFGQEANTDSGRLLQQNSDYQKDGYYSYDFAIAHRNEGVIPKSQCRLTEYLKTRLIISGVSDFNHIQETQVLSILCNNLNKSSIGGKKTPCNQSVDRILYSSFAYNGYLGNIFLQEINVLRPSHLVFLSGKGYNEHIKRDFGETFYYLLEPTIRQLRYEHPVSKQIEISPKKIEELWNIHQYPYPIKIIYGYHPQTYLSRYREKYNNALSRFVKA